MWSNVGAVVLLLLIVAILVFGLASLYRGMFVSGRTTAHGDDVEDLMFHESWQRHQDEAAGLPVTPRWWHRGRRPR